VRIAVPGLPSAWSLRPRGRHALAVTRSAARGLIAPVAARAAAARAGTHTSHDATAWAVAGPVAARRERRRPDCSIGHITVHKAQNGGVALRDDDENVLRKRYYRLVRLELRWIATIARLARIPGPVGTRRTVCTYTDRLYHSIQLLFRVRKRITHYKCAMQIKCHFVCHQHHHRPHRARTPSRFTRCGTEAEHRARGGCVVRRAGSAPRAGARSRRDLHAARHAR
jgi:hypothetical protein